MKKIVRFSTCAIIALAGMILVSCKSTNTVQTTTGNNQQVNIRKVRVVQAVCSQRIQEPLKKTVWIESPEGLVTAVMVQNALKHYGLAQSTDKEKADYIFSAKIGVINYYSRRAVISYVATLKKNNTAKNIVWIGTASCSAKTKYNIADFTPSMFACIMTQFNRTYNGQIGFATARSMFDIIMGLGI